jgi:hypothetical protein
MKLDGNDIKEVDTFTYLGSCINKNGKIQNEINERLRKASNFHHLVKGLIRNRDINNKCKIDIYKVYFKKILLYGAESWMCTERRKQDPGDGNEIPERNPRKNQKRQNKKQRH